MFEKKIGITQKLVRHPRYDETLACLDINWYRFFDELEATPVPIPIRLRSVEDFEPDLSGLDGVIFSGGNSLSDLIEPNDSERDLCEIRDRFESKLLRRAIEVELPVLGVCRGMQLINSFFFGSFKKTPEHVGTRHPITSAVRSTEVNALADVNSYHEFSIPLDCIGNGLVPFAFDTERYVEGLRHQTHQILAVMWHPERECTFSCRDIDMIREHFRI